MNNIRLIARLDIKGPNLIKGIHLEGLRVIGDPYQYARKYYEDGIDELVYIDAVASLYGRNSLKKVIEHTAKDVFIPLTVGGGIRSVEDVRDILRSGADKVAVNTSAVRCPRIISKISNVFGSQCVVLSVQAKKIRNNKWEAFINNGREGTGLDVMEWIKTGIRLGAGELLITSIDQEGTRKGFDIDLMTAVAQRASVPVIASGGMGNQFHIVDLIKNARIEGVAMADVLHYNRISLHGLRDGLQEAGLGLRTI